MKIIGGEKIIHVARAADSVDNRQVNGWNFLVLAGVF